MSATLAATGRVHLLRHGEDEGGWDEFIRGVGPMTMGATTYEWMLQRHDADGPPAVA